MNMETEEINRDDRRRLPRFSLDLPLILSYPAGQPLDEKTKLQDISQGGFKFSTSFTLAPGDSFRFSVEFPENKKISGMALTRWISRNDTSDAITCGAQIISLRWGERRVLRRNLEPPVELFNSADMIDLVLLFVCGMVYLQVFHELGMFDFRTYNPYAAYFIHSLRNMTVPIGLVLLLGAFIGF